MRSKKPNILILSWEILPLMTGGLGVLVRSLVDELRHQGASVTVLVPHDVNGKEASDLISLATRTRYFYKQKKPIPGIEDFVLNEFVSETKKNYARWPQLYSKGSGKKSQINLYPPHTPALTRAFGFAALEWIQSQSIDFDLIYGMDWMATPALFLLKHHGITVPFYYHLNSTQVDRSGGEGIIGVTAKALFSLEQKGFELCDGMAVVSEVSRQGVIEGYNIAPEKVFTVYNDITFEPETKGYDDLDFGKNVLFIGRVVPQKGLSFLIDTAARVVQIDPQVKIIVAGDGTPDANILPDIIEDVAKKELEKNVVFTGWVNGDAKKQLYKTCQLFVMPSPSEPFGLTALEAIRSGVPTIASETSGFIGVVPSTPTFAYHDTDAFANSILHFIQDNEARMDLLRRQKADLVNHSWSREVKKLLSIIPS